MKSETKTKQDLRELLRESAALPVDQRINHSEMHRALIRQFGVDTAPTYTKYYRWVNGSGEESAIPSVQRTFLSKILKERGFSFNQAIRK